jgi:hypothetical protein
MNRFNLHIEYAVRGADGYLEVKSYDCDVSDCKAEGASDEDLLENRGWKISKEPGFVEFRAGNVIPF